MTTCLMQEVVVISINTNKAGIISQASLGNATQLLNQSIERMTSGFRINRSSDNAANYAITTMLTTKIGAYEMAESNAGMGLDMLTTAQDSLSQISAGLSKLRTLSVQAQNGTSGDHALTAINREAASITANIQQLLNSAEYNGIKLLNTFAQPDLPEGFSQTDMPKASYNGFIKNPVTYSDAEVDAMTSISTVDSFTSGQKYSIKNADELAKLGALVDSGVDTTGAIFVLAGNIDLSTYSSGEGWNPIGDLLTSDKSFKGTFDGNGHTITNLKINTNNDIGALFAELEGGTIKNVGITNIDIIGGDNVTGVSGLVAQVFGGEIDNCYTVGNIYSTEGAASGLAIEAMENSTITSCYSSCNLQTKTGSASGLVAQVNDSTITSCYSTGNVKISVGGEFKAGLVCIMENSSLTSCYSTGNLDGETFYGGGLVGQAISSSITSCYSTSNVSLSLGAGGLVGMSIDTSISSCYTTGNVEGLVSGGLIGGIGATNEVLSCYSTGNVTGVIGSSYTATVGGLIGIVDISDGSTLTIDNSTSYSNVYDGDIVGGFVGQVINTSDNTTFGTLNITNSKVLPLGFDKIGLCSDEDNNPNTHGLDTMLAGIETLVCQPAQTDLQVGINGDEGSRISIKTGLTYGLFNKLNGLQMEDEQAISIIDEIIKEVSSKETDIGSVSNRLESVLESISTHYENLVSSRSTLRDTDIAEESSRYIKAQILQQASATLLSTANQTPTLALSLLQGVM